MRRMAASEFETHWALYQEEPWGERRIDLLMAQLLAFLANRLQFGKNRRRYKATDFLPGWWDEAEPGRMDAPHSGAQAAFDQFKHLARKEVDDGAEG